MMLKMHTGRNMSGYCENEEGWMYECTKCEIMCIDIIRYPVHT
jgi:hypothetical protein